MTLRSRVDGVTTAPAPLRRLPLPAWTLWPAASALVLAFAVHLFTVVLWPDLWIMIDVHVYRAAGTALLSGQPLYDGDILGALKFVYTPFAALVFVPLSLLPMEALRWLANAGNLAVLVAIIWFCWGALGYRADRARLAASLGLAAVTFWFEPVRTTTWLGQINLVLVLVLVVDLGRWRRRSDVGVGLVTGIKLTPGIFLPYLLLTRQLRAAAVASLTLAATIVAGFLVTPTGSWRFWTGTFLRSDRMGHQAANTNQSLHGTVTRLLGEGTASTVAWLVVAVSVACFGLWTARRASLEGHRLVALTATGVTGTLVSPFSWSHHWVWFVPGAVVLADLGVRGRGRGWVGLLALWAWVAPWPVSPIPPPGDPAPAMGLFLAAPSGGWEWLYGESHVWAGLVLLVVIPSSLRASRGTKIRGGGGVKVPGVMR